MFTKQTIRDIDLSGKRVLVRAEFDVPIADGKVTDDYRIKLSLPTFRYLLEQKCEIVVLAHLGRPDGKVMPELSLRPVAERLRKLLQASVSFVNDCVGEDVKKACGDLGPGKIVVLENTRFHPEEKRNDKRFAEEIVRDTGAKVFVAEDFGVAHRAHASVEAVAHLLPGVAGLLLEKEVDTITRVLDKPERPLVAIIGGAKIADKIDVLNRCIEIADFVAVGGAMANTFLAAQGIDIGESLYDKVDIPVAKDIMKKAAVAAKQRRFIFAIPRDGVVVHKIDKTAPTRIVDWGTQVIADIESYPRRVPADAGRVHAHEKIVDIGPFSGAFVAGGVQLANTVIWNGAMGVTETKSLQGPVGPYAHGTELVIDALLGDFGHKPFTLVGGGDTVGYIENRKLTDCFDHVSTGGGASLELMAGRKLPGVEALLNKK